MYGVCVYGVCVHGVCVPGSSVFLYRGDMIYLLSIIISFSNLVDPSSSHLLQLLIDQNPHGIEMLVSLISKPKDSVTVGRGGINEEEEERSKVKSRRNESYFNPVRSSSASWSQVKKSWALSVGSPSP